MLCTTKEVTSPNISRKIISRRLLLTHALWVGNDKPKQKP